MDVRIKNGICLGVLWSIALIEPVVFYLASFATGLIAGCDLTLIFLNMMLKKDYGFNLDGLDDYIKEVKHAGQGRNGTESEKLEAQRKEEGKKVG